jgi:hypothetical protein
MSALDRFEDWLHGVFEGRLAGILGAEIQPVDIARRLADHMEDRRAIGAGRTYVPNNYRLYLAPRTLAAFAAYQNALEHEVASFLLARAAERGLHFVGRVHVALLPDVDLPAAQLRIESDLVDRRDLVGGGHGHTEAIAVPPAPPAETALPAALVVGRRRFVLPADRSATVGRALDNDVILDDASVSRHHARLSPRGRQWLLEDLDSTHGCFINTHPVSAGLLRTGDLVRLGTVTVRIEIGTEGGTT